MTNVGSSMRKSRKGAQADTSMQQEAPAAGKKPRLADQISSLLSSAAPTEHDPDGLENEFAGAPALGDTWGLGEMSDDDALPVQAPEKGLRLRAGIDLAEEDDRYAGRVVSRRERKRQLGHDDADSENDNAGVETDGAESDEEREDSEGGVFGGGLAGQSDASEGADDDLDVDGSKDGGENDADEDDEIAAAVAELEQEQEANVMRLVSVTSADKEKAAHARHQRDLTDLLLESRIRLQKPLSLAASLPRGPAAVLLRRRVLEVARETEACAEEVQPLLVGVVFALAAFPGGTASSNSQNSSMRLRRESRQVAGLFEDLLAMRASLWRQNAALPAPESWAERTRAGSLKRARDGESLARAQTADREMEAFRDATIDKWDGKVKAGAGAAPASKFKALNQSVLSQVQTVLQDSARLIRRTRVKRSSYRVLGAALFASPENKGSSAVAELYGDGAGGRGDDEPAAEGGKSARGLQEEDSEAYDDADFYQLLLRDLIESAASAEDATELQAQLRAARRRVGKAGKNVDTKASKGRKLRFDIQPKLVNFMFPETRERPAFMEALLDNIFKA